MKLTDKFSIQMMIMTLTVGLGVAILIISPEVLEPIGTLVSSVGESIGLSIGGSEVVTIGEVEYAVIED